MREEKKISKKKIVSLALTLLSASVLGLVYYKDSRIAIVDRASASGKSLDDSVAREGACVAVFEGGYANALADAEKSSDSNCFIVGCGGVF